MDDVRRKTYMDRDDFTVRLEDTQGIIFVHVEMKGEITTQMVRTLRKEFNILKQKLALANYEYVHSYSATPKFYSLFKGYEDIGAMIWDEKEYRVLRWELK